MHDDLAPHYDAMYDALYGDAFHAATDGLLRILQGLCAPPARVLDVGAGTGRIALPLAALGYAVTAVEPSRGMLECLAHKARLEAQHISLRAGVVPAALLPQDQHFALALLAFGVLDYMVDDANAELALNAIRERSAPGGLCVVQPAPRLYMASRREEGGRFIREVDLRWEGEVAHLSHIVQLDEQTVADETLTMRYRSPAELQRLFERTGWRVRAETSDGAYPTWLLGRVGDGLGQEASGSCLR